MSTERELDPELAKLIGHARGDTLSSDAVEALAQRFSGTIPAAASPRVMLWKIFGIGAIGLAGVVAGALWLSPNGARTLEKSGSTFPTSAAAAAKDPETKPTTVLDLDENAPPKRAAPVGSNTSVQEFELIRAARAALPTDPARALALARTHEKKFPHGVLAQEREVIVISALKKLGKTGEADSRADAFKKSHPESAHNPKFDPAKAP